MKIFISIYLVKQLWWDIYNQYYHIFLISYNPTNIVNQYFSNIVHQSFTINPSNFPPSGLLLPEPAGIPKGVLLGRKRTKGCFWNGKARKIIYTQWVHGFSTSFSYVYRHFLEFLRFMRHKKQDQEWWKTIGLLEYAGEYDNWTR